MGKKMNYLKQAMKARKNPMIIQKHLTQQKTKRTKLIKCEKLRKFVTEKTMKYTHNLKCCIVKKSRPNKYEITMI